MAKILRMRVDIQIFEDSEPWLYNLLIQMAPRSRGRYLKNAAVLHSHPKTMVLERPSATVITGTPADSQPPTASAPDLLAQMTDTIAAHMDSVVPCDSDIPTVAEEE